MSKREFTIRPAETGDEAAVAEIYAPYVTDTAISFETEPPSAATMAQRIITTLKTHPWLVAERGSEIVGYANAGRHRERPVYRWSVETTIYVRNGVRRSGVGRALYVPLMEVLRRQGFRSALAEIVLPNPGSVRLHEAVGFMPIGVHKDVGFKLGRWHNIGYWRLGLADGSETPSEPLPFAVFRDTPAFAAAIRPTHDQPIKTSVQQ
jgi:L-amino acid N-acyltransferase YncA